MDSGLWEQDFSLFDWEFTGKGGEGTREIYVVTDSSSLV